jgi:hypothetical protein
MMTSISMGKKYSCNFCKFQLAVSATMKSDTALGGSAFLQNNGLSIVSLRSQLSFHA